MALVRRFIGRRRICFSSLLFFVLISLLTALYSYIPIENKLSAEDKNGVMIMLSESKFQKEYIDKKGIHVIVGQYNGKSFPWNGSPNLTQEILNLNNYHPVPRLGEGGAPVFIPDHEKEKMKVLYFVNMFNIMASDRISVKRSLPDPRKKSCRAKIYSRDIGNASVVIVFHNEAWSTLLRTVHSVLNTSPPSILHEIILVDDASTRTFLGPELEKYMNDLSIQSRVSIRIARSSQRIGLIKARMIGARMARGKVLTFLDAHCEATIGWLEPLLDRIAENRTRVVCPVIDIIHEETFAFARSFELHWGGINWNLHFRWYPIGRKELTQIQRSNGESSDPFKTPIMAGGLFAIERNFFFEMGAYDEQMDIWGGENIEMSLRLWQCGSSLEIVPCSHVAHLFRKSSPYTFPRRDGVTGVLYTNLARVIHVWMNSDYRNFFYRINPVMKKTIYGDPMSSAEDLVVQDVDSIPEKLHNISERLELKSKLKCKSFSWFLDQIWPEHFFPTRDRFFGQIRSDKHSECLVRPNANGGPSNSNVGRLDLDRCAIEMYSPQCFVYTKQATIMTDESVCLDIVPSGSKPSVLLLACSGQVRQKWKFDPKEKTLRHLQTNLCLEIDRKRRLVLSKCAHKTSQKWSFIPFSWYEP